MSHAGYISMLFEPEKLNDYAKELAKAINRDKLKFNINCVAFRGMSGAVIAGIVSAKTKLPIVMVRKNDNSHSYFNVEFDDNLEYMNYCVVDDLIASGNTLREIMRGIENKAEVPNRLIKIYLYNDVKHSYIIDDVRYPVECVDPYKDDEYEY